MTDQLPARISSATRAYRLIKATKPSKGNSATVINCMDLRPEKFK